MCLEIDFPITPEKKLSVIEAMSAFPAGLRKIISRILFISGGPRIVSTGTRNPISFPIG